MQNSINHQNIIIALVVVVTLVLLLTVIILFYSFHRYNIIDNKTKWTLIIDDLISKAVVFGSTEAIEESQISPLIHKKRFRNQLLQTLVSTTRRFSGSAIFEVANIFHFYNLKKDATKKLKSKKDHIVAGGIQELTAMQVVESFPEIEKLLESKNPVIYQEAQYATLTLKGFEGLDFLNHFHYILSDWQQLRLLSSINQAPINQEKRISNWLHSDNYSIQIFTLRLIRKFQLFVFYDEIEKLINTTELTLKLQCIKALFALENDRTIKYFIHIFKDEPLKAQIEILKGILKSKDGVAIDFLKNIVQNDNNPTLRIKAAECLVDLNQEHYLLDLKVMADSELSSIISHALNEKL